MRSMWTCFILSVLSLVTGFTLVLIFTLLYVVPTISTRAVVRTQCYVEAISLYGHMTGSHVRLISLRNMSSVVLSFKGSSEEDDLSDRVIDLHLKDNVQSRADTNSTDVVGHSGVVGMVSNVSCPVVTVSYSLQDGRRMKGHLYQHSNYLTLDPQLGVTAECFCKDCKVNLKQAPYHSKSHKGYSTVRQGETLKCFYRTFSAQYSVDSTLDSLVLLNAMFWPTLLFITGFVGVFFTCIFLAKEDWKWRREEQPQECKMT